MNIDKNQIEIVSSDHEIRNRLKSYWGKRIVTSEWIFSFEFTIPSFFFFGSDPNPDDPDVIDESSLTPPTKPGSVFTLAVAGITPAGRDIVVPGKLDDGVFSTPTIISLPKSSRDAILFLLFKLDVGLNECEEKIMNRNMDH